jgi:NAD(P)-dependent dehydrogenase (short-subunit alcohol dehydrogenase family)
MPDDQREAMYRNVGASLPVGRVGDTEDIAEAYLYLMRERYSTGQVIVVDGGTVLGVSGGEASPPTPRAP